MDKLTKRKRIAGALFGWGDIKRFWCGVFAETVFDVLKRELQNRGIHMEFAYTPVYFNSGLYWKGFTTSMNLTAASSLRLDVQSKRLFYSVGYSAVHALRTGIKSNGFTRATSEKMWREGRGRMKRDAFFSRHPVDGVCLLPPFVIGFSMLFMNPACLCRLSYVCRSYSVYLSGKKAVMGFQLRGALLPLLLFDSAVLNPAI